MKSTPITFRLTYTVTDHLLSDAVKEEQSWISKPSNCQLTLDRQVLVTGQPASLVLSVVLARALEPPVEAMFHALAEGRLPEGSNPSEARGDVTRERKLKLNHVPPLRAMPAALQEFVTEAHREMYSTAEAAISVLRWRAGFASGSPRTMSLRKDEFSLDCESWNPAPHGLTMRFGVDLPVSKKGITRDMIASAGELLEMRYSEPLSRSLFREAWALRDSNHSSALVIGFTAIEVGTKELIQTLVPNAGWLAFELPSPPLDRILKHYVPRLPARLTFGGRVVVPDRIRKLIISAMKERNKLAHRGVMRLAESELEAILRGINDLLWLFDIYSGHGWAWDHVSVEARREIRAQSAANSPP
jgi:hypothetical protein